MKKLLKMSAVLAFVAGLVMVVGGFWGIGFTYKNVSQEKIVTPEDASIPNTPVRGPLTLRSQAEIIRHHTFNTTGGKTYAEMERTDPTRATWITATTLTTALNLGIVTYVFSAMVLLMGFISLWTGMIFWMMSKTQS